MPRRASSPSRRSARATASPSPLDPYQYGKLDELRSLGDVRRGTSRTTELCIVSLAGVLRLALNTLLSHDNRPHVRFDGRGHLDVRMSPFWLQIMAPTSREAEARLLQRTFAARGRVLLHVAFCASCFTYSLVGAAMLLHFNRHLPRAFWDAAPIDVDTFAWLLVVQGLLSFWADAWARTIARVPLHPAYLADRALAIPMTVLTLYLGIVCWHEPSSPVGRRLAATSALGLVPFVGSQVALRLSRFDAFMAMHICWHVSIPLVAVLWLGHTACGGFA